jgi:hypothetical protein
MCLCAQTARADLDLLSELSILENICDYPGIREADNCLARSSRLEGESANDKVLF